MAAKQLFYIKNDAFGQIARGLIIENATVVRSPKSKARPLVLETVENEPESVFPSG